MEEIIKYANLSTRLKKNEGGYSLSMYKGAIATDKELTAEVQVLGSVFQFDNRMLALLVSVMRDDNFTSERAKDAVKYCVKNSKKRTPSIADIVAFDKGLKLYTYGEYCNTVFNNKEASEDFEVLKDKNGNKIMREGACLWYRKSELAKLIEKLNH